MEFMKVQDHKTGVILKRFIDKKRVTESEFENEQETQISEGKNYNSSYTVRDGKTNNFIHVHHYN